MRGTTGGLGHRDGIAFDPDAVGVQRDESPVAAGRIQQPVSRRSAGSRTAQRTRAAATASGVK